MQLHKLVNRELGEVLVFESYGIVSTPPESGDQVILRPWWTPDAWNAATDPQRNWQRRIYDESDHDHCLLTWQTISVGEEAYRSELGEWVSADAYERFIRNDVLRLRDAG
jgi:hypothetical protein